MRSMKKHASLLGVAASLAAIVALSFAGVSGAGDDDGATQISGIGFLDFGEECDVEDEGADFAMHLTGDLQGCHYVFVDGWECLPSGTYREWGTEMFVGDYNGESGTFETTYLFTAMLEDCDLSLEIFGRCQHPIVAGSGTGVFDGVTGRFDIKDDVETGELLYRGHLRW